MSVTGLHKRCGACEAGVDPDESGLGRQPQVQWCYDHEPVKRATVLIVAAFTRSRGLRLVSHLFLGLTPQALCSTPASQAQRLFVQSIPCQQSSIFNQQSSITSAAASSASASRGGKSCDPRSTKPGAGAFDLYHAGSSRIGRWTCLTRPRSPGPDLHESSS